MRGLTKTDRRMGVISVRLIRNATDDGFGVDVTVESFDKERAIEVALIKRCIVDALTKYSRRRFNTVKHSTTH